MALPTNPDPENPEAGDRALQIADARWRALLDAAVDGMIVIDAHGIIEAFNPAAERMFGHSRDEVLGRNVRLLMPPADAAHHDEHLARYLATGLRRIIGIGRDVTALRRDGVRFPVHLSVGEMRIGDERRFVGIVHDLTARTKLEEQIREQASMARLGEMAAVLAHEVRNPLAAVRGAIQVLGKRLATETRDAEVVKEILARLDGLNNLVMDLLLYARTPTLRLAPTELRHVLDATIQLLTRDPLFRSLDVHVSGGEPPLMADPDLLKNVFQNILLNAAQALEGRGAIRVTIAATPTSQTVAVSDNGPGMTPEVRAQLFRPFFTTKSRGTGLGLPTVRRIVEAHGGAVAVECPETGGTTVAIELPVERQPAPPRQEA